MDTNPFRSPSHLTSPDTGSERGQQRMSPFEHAAVLLHLACLVIYIPAFAFFALSGWFAAGPTVTLLAVHFSLMLFGLVVFVLIVRDLYLREHFTPNQKLTWGLMFCLLTPSIWVYYFLHAWKPRDHGDVAPSGGRSN